MAMVCPRCRNSFNDRMLCPTCNVRLVPSGSSTYELGPSAAPAEPPRWQQTYLGRGLVGLMVAQGMYYGLWQLCTAVVVASTEDVNRLEWGRTTQGWLLLVVLQGVSLIVAGGLAGAGQRHGIAIGLGIGFVNSLLWIIMQSTIGQMVYAEEVYGQPLFQVICGGLGGYLGSTIWKPMITLGRRPRSIAAIPNHQPTPHRMRLLNAFKGPVAWFRVCLGVLTGIAGSVWANLILIYIVSGSKGLMTVQSTRQALFVTWEISVLLMLLAGAVAGANCRNGAKQGLVVGLICCFLLIMVYVQGGLEIIPQNLLFQAPSLLHLNLGLPGATATVIFTFLSVFPLAILGGWFGGELLPPLLHRPGGSRWTTPIGV